MQNDSVKFKNYPAIVLLVVFLLVYLGLGITIAFDDMLGSRSLYIACRAGSVEPQYEPIPPPPGIKADQWNPPNVHSLCDNYSTQALVGQFLAATFFGPLKTINEIGMDWSTGKDTNGQADQNARVEPVRLQ